MTTTALVTVRVCLEGGASFSAGFGFAAGAFGAGVGFGAGLEGLLFSSARFFCSRTSRRRSAARRLLSSAAVSICLSCCGFFGGLAGGFGAALFCTGVGSGSESEKSGTFFGVGGFFPRVGGRR